MSRQAGKIALRRVPDDEPETGSTRERILSAAERLFAEHGYGNVSMPVIAKASGITAGAIYKHFESKEALFFTVVERAVHAVPVAAEGQDLPHVVAQYTTARLKRVRQFAVEMHYASARHPKVKRLLRRSLEHNIGQIRDGILVAQKAGMVDPSLDAQLLASSVMTFIMGLMHMETLLPEFVDEKRWQDFVADRVAALVGMRK